MTSQNEEDDIVQTTELFAFDEWCRLFWSALENELNYPGTHAGEECRIFQNWIVLLTLGTNKQPPCVHITLMENTNFTGAIGGHRFSYDLRNSPQDAGIQIAHKLRSVIK